MLKEKMDRKMQDTQESTINSIRRLRAQAMKDLEAICQKVGVLFSSVQRGPDLFPYFEERHIHPKLLNTLYYQYLGR